MTSEMKQKLVQAWLAASCDLGITVVAPFVLDLEGTAREYIALVPDFSQPKGILVAALPFDGPTFDDAQRAGYGCSFFNPESYCAYERQRFLDVLIEWGFTGSSDTRPGWLPST